MATSGNYLINITSPRWTYLSVNGVNVGRDFQMADLVYKRNDVPAALAIQLQNNDGTSYNLTGNTSVTFFWKNQATGVLQSRACSVTSLMNGIVSFAWQSGDLQTSGTYYCEIEVEFSSNVVTFPGGAYLVVQVRDDLENA